MGICVMMGVHFGLS